MPVFPPQAHLDWNHLGAFHSHEALVGGGISKAVWALNSHSSDCATAFLRQLLLCKQCLTRKEATTFYVWACRSLIDFYHARGGAVCGAVCCTAGGNAPCALSGAAPCALSGAIGGAVYGFPCVSTE